MVAQQDIIEYLRGKEWTTLNELQVVFSSCKTNINRKVNKLYRFGIVEVLVSFNGPGPYKQFVKLKRESQKFPVKKQGGKNG